MAASVWIRSVLPAFYVHCTVKSEITPAVTEPANSCPRGYVNRKLADLKAEDSPVLLWEGLFPQFYNRKVGLFILAYKLGIIFFAGA